MNMGYQWKDKILLITGASKGIGANVIRLALEEGVQQIFNLDIDVENGILLQHELNRKYGENTVKFIECDVTNDEQMRTNFELIMKNRDNDYVVINNAGICNDSLQTFKKEIDTNVTALVAGSLIALDLMRKDKGGKGGTIINISSQVALSPLPYTPIYNATKSAVLIFSTGLGADEYYTRSEVRVLTICFGLTMTSFVTLNNMGSFDEVMAKRLLEPQSKYPSQSVESAAHSLIEMFKYGESGSVWLSNGNKPVEDITNVVSKAFEIMSEPVFK